MKKTILASLILIPALLFQIINAEKAQAAVLLDRIVATVNDEVITWSELMDLILMDGKDYLAGSTGREREQKIEKIERPFLNNLIGMKLQIQEAQKMGLYVSDSEIMSAIDEIKTKYGLTDEALETSLKSEGLTMEDYEKRLADRILLQKTVNYTVRNKIIISDKEVEEYYEKNKEKFNTGEQFRIRQIFFAMPTDEAEKSAIEARALELLNRINNGEDFAKLAKEYSEDPSSEFGGDLGYISRGNVLKEIEEVTAALKKGEVSRPFWSPAGLHIIKLEDRKGGRSPEEVRERIRETLFQEAFETKYREWRNSLREAANIEIKL